MADTPIAIGDFITTATANNMSPAIKTRTDKKMNGSAYGRPYFAPTKPVLHRSTKRTGANLASFKPRKSISTELMILPSTWDYVPWHLSSSTIWLHIQVLHSHQKTR